MTVPRRPGGQVAPEQYFATAMAILGRDGASGLKIGPLCHALGVTSGSFYHHFDGWSGFVRALLEDWEKRQTARVVELARASADPLERMEVLKRLTLGLPHRAEAAIRAWGTLDTDVGRSQRRVDEQRRIALEQVVAGVVADPVVADRLAVMGMSLLIGFQAGPEVDVAVLGELLDEYRGAILRHATLS